MLAKRLANVRALGSQERVGHATTDDQHVDLGYEVFQKIDLGRYLCAANYRQNRTDRLAKRGAQGFQFCLHRAAGIGRQQFGNAFRGTVGPVRSGEGIVDIDVAVGGERLGKFRIVLFLALVIAGVFQKQNIAVGHRPDGVSRCFTDAIFGKGDVAAKKSSNGRSDGCKRHGSHTLAFRTTEMGQKDHLGTLFGQFPDGWQNAFDTGCVGDLFTVHRNVQVHANQSALAGDVSQIVESFESHVNTCCQGRVELVVTAMPMPNKVSRTPNERSIQSLARMN